MVQQYEKLITDFNVIKTQVSNFLSNSGPSIIHYAKVVCLVFSGITLFSIIIILLKAHNYLYDSFISSLKGANVPADKPGKLRRQWAEIENQIKSESIDDAKLALIKADALLDDIMKRAGFPGETMGDRLKKFDKAELANIDEVWKAHKLRNQIAHEPNKEFRFIEIKNSIKAIENAIKDLQGM